MLKAIFNYFLILSVVLNAVCLSSAYSNEVNLPTLKAYSSYQQNNNPIHLKGIKLDSKDSFKLNFILEQKNKMMSTSDQKKEAEKLIRYFLTALTVPESNLWVNLSPFEKNRIISTSLGQTDMGLTLLAQDVSLKLKTAQLMHIDGKIGNDFWRRLYEEVNKTMGTTNIMVDSVNKVWIVPNKAVIYQGCEHERSEDLRVRDNNCAYIKESRLSVMLEQDYVATKSSQSHLALHSTLKTLTQQQKLMQSLIKKIILPQLEREVNEGDDFIPLRQIFESIILATWFKTYLQQNIINKSYSDKNQIQFLKNTQRDHLGKTKDLSIERIYQDYIKSFKQGFYQFIKEDSIKLSKPIIRKYVLGGFDLAMLHSNYSPKSVFTISSRSNAFPESNYFKAQINLKPIKLNDNRDEAMLIDNQIDTLFNLVGNKLSEKEQIAIRVLLRDFKNIDGLRVKTILAQIAKSRLWNTDIDKIKLMRIIVRVFTQKNLILDSSGWRIQNKDRFASEDEVIKRVFDMVNLLHNKITENNLAEILNVLLELNVQRVKQFEEINGAIKLLAESSDEIYEQVQFKSWFDNLKSAKHPRLLIKGLLELKELSLSSPHHFIMMRNKIEDLVNQDFTGEQLLNALLSLRAIITIDNIDEIIKLILKINTDLNKYIVLQTPRSMQKELNENAAAVAEGLKYYEVNFNIEEQATVFHTVYLDITRKFQRGYGVLIYQILRKFHVKEDKFSEYVSLLNELARTYHSHFDSLIRLFDYFKDSDVDLNQLIQLVTRITTLMKSNPNSNIEEFYNKLVDLFEGLSKPNAYLVLSDLANQTHWFSKKQGLYLENIKNILRIFNEDEFMKVHLSFLKFLMNISDNDFHKIIKVAQELKEFSVKKSVQIDFESYFDLLVHAGDRAVKLNNIWFWLLVKFGEAPSEFERLFNKIQVIIQRDGVDAINVLDSLISIKKGWDEEVLFSHYKIIYDSIQKVTFKDYFLEHLKLAHKFWDESNLAEFCEKLQHEKQRPPNNDFFYLIPIIDKLIQRDNFWTRMNDLNDIVAVNDQFYEEAKGFTPHALNVELVDYINNHWNDLLSIFKFRETKSAMQRESAHLNLGRSSVWDVVQLFMILGLNDHKAQLSLSEHYRKNAKKIIDQIMDFKKSQDKEKYDQIIKYLNNYQPENIYFTKIIQDLLKNVHLSWSDLTRELFGVISKPLKVEDNQGYIHHAINIALKILTMKQLRIFLEAKNPKVGLDEILLDQNHQPIFNQINFFIEGLNEQQRRDFISHVLLQVAQDASIDENGLFSYQRMNNIIHILVNLKQRHGGVNEFFETNQLPNENFQNLYAELIKNGGYLSSWKNFQRIVGLIRWIEHKEVFDVLNRLKEGSEHGEKLYAYYTQLLLHPSMINTDALLKMITDPENFLAIDDLHMRTLHDVKKPSRLLSIPHIDLKARELIDALVLGDLDKVQVMPSFKMEIPVDKLDKNFDQLKGGELIKYLLTKRFIDEKELKQVLIRLVKERLNQLQNPEDKLQLPKNHQRLIVTLTDILLKLNQDEQSLLMLADSMVKFTFDINVLNSHGLRLEKFIVNILPKSSPQAIMSGSEVPTCMGFGTGKNNVYMFNPNTLILTLSHLVNDNVTAEVKERIIATSVVTLDRYMPITMPVLLNNVLQDIQNRKHFDAEQVLGSDFINKVSTDAFIGIDNVEASTNQLRYQIDFNEFVKRAYTLFFQQYLSVYKTTRRGRLLNQHQANVGSAYTKALADLPKQDNHYVMQTPVSYSDKIQAKVGVLDLELENKEIRVQPDKLNGIYPLSYEDTIEVAYIENRAFKNRGFGNNLAGIEMELIAATYNEAIKGDLRKNLSLGYFEDGKLLGYLIAYVGVDMKGKEIIYISDISVLRKNAKAGGNLLNSFFENAGTLIDRFKEEYNINLPIIFEAMSDKEGSLRFLPLDNDSETIKKKKKERLFAKGFEIVKQQQLSDGRYSIQLNRISKDDNQEVVEAGIKVDLVEESIPNKITIPPNKITILPDKEAFNRLREMPTGFVPKSFRERIRSFLSKSLRIIRRDKAMLTKKISTGGADFTYVNRIIVKEARLMDDKPNNLINNRIQNQFDALVPEEILIEPIKDLNNYFEINLN